MISLSLAGDSVPMSASGAGVALAVATDAATAFAAILTEADTAAEGPALRTPHELTSPLAPVPKTAELAVIERQPEMQPGSPLTATVQVAVPSSPAPLLDGDLPSAALKPDYTLQAPTPDLTGLDASPKHHDAKPVDDEPVLQDVALPASPLPGVPDTAAPTPLIQWAVFAQDTPVIGTQPQIQGLTLDSPRAAPSSEPHLAAQSQETAAVPQNLSLAPIALVDTPQTNAPAFLPPPTSNQDPTRFPGTLPASNPYLQPTQALQSSRLLDRTSTPIPDNASEPSPLPRTEAVAEDGANQPLHRAKAAIVLARATQWQEPALAPPSLKTSVQASPIANPALRVGPDAPRSAKPDGGPARTSTAAQTGTGPSRSERPAAVLLIPSNPPAGVSASAVELPATLSMPAPAPQHSTVWATAAAVTAIPSVGAAPEAPGTRPPSFAGHLAGRPSRAMSSQSVATRFNPTWPPQPPISPDPGVPADVPSIIAGALELAAVIAPVAPSRLIAEPDRNLSVAPAAETGNLESRAIVGEVIPVTTELRPRTITTVVTGTAPRPSGPAEPAPRPESAAPPTTLSVAIPLGASPAILNRVLRQPPAETTPLDVTHPHVTLGASTPVVQPELATRADTTSSALIEPFATAPQPLARPSTPSGLVTRAVPHRRPSTTLAPQEAVQAVFFDDQFQTDATRGSATATDQSVAPPAATRPLDGALPVRAGSKAVPVSSAKMADPLVNHGPTPFVPEARMALAIAQPAYEPGIHRAMAASSDAKPDKGQTASRSDHPVAATPTLTWIHDQPVQPMIDSRPVVAYPEPVSAEMARPDISQAYLAVKPRVAIGQPAVAAAQPPFQPQDVAANLAPAKTTARLLTRSDKVPLPAGTASAVPAARSAPQPETLSPPVQQQALRNLFQARPVSPDLSAAEAIPAPHRTRGAPTVVLQATPPSTSAKTAPNRNAARGDQPVVDPHVQASITGNRAEIAFAGKMRNKTADHSAGPPSIAPPFARAVIPRPPHAPTLPPMLRSLPPRDTEAPSQRSQVESFSLSDRPAASLYPEKRHQIDTLNMEATRRPTSIIRTEPEHQLSRPSSIANDVAQTPVAAGEPAIIPPSNPVQPALSSPQAAPLWSLPGAARYVAVDTGPTDGPAYSHTSSAQNLHSNRPNAHPALVPATDPISPFSAEPPNPLIAVLPGNALAPVQSPRLPQTAHQKGDTAPAPFPGYTPADAPVPTTPVQPFEAAAHPASARRLPHGLAPSLARAATHAPRDAQVELTLHPAELGKLRFEITTTNDRTQINLTVERPDTLDLLRRHADVLRAEFRAAGFDGATLNFSQWSRQGNDNATHPTLPPDFAPESADPSPPVALAKRTLNTAGQGLDLRL